MAVVQSHHLVQLIQHHIREQRYEISIHAERERRNDGLTVLEIEDSILANGELLEDYPADPRGHSCLVLSFTPGGRPVHTVWGFLSTGWIRLITVYVPTWPWWVDPRTRRERTR